MFEYVLQKLIKMIFDGYLLLYLKSHVYEPTNGYGSSTQIFLHCVNSSIALKITFKQVKFQSSNTGDAFSVTKRSLSVLKGLLQ